MGAARFHGASIIMLADNLAEFLMRTTVRTCMRKYF